MADRSAYGGQAVIEGVMIRGKSRVATACRRKDGSITIRRDEVSSVTQRHRWLRLAFLRGTPALIDSLRLGYQTLMWSADQAMEGEEVQQKPNGLQLLLTTMISLAFGIGIFVWLPSTLIGLLVHRPPISHDFSWTQFIPARKYILPNILEGILRLLFLIVYILIIGRNKEIARVFSYHGAEHKVVNAWEARGELGVDVAKEYSRIHPRCGTSFLFLLFVVGILIHALIGWPWNPLVRFASRLLLLPIIAGVAYELIRLSGRYRHSHLMQALIWPGLLLQRLTTAEPTDEQIEVAVASLCAVLEDEGEAVKSEG